MYTSLPWAEDITRVYEFQRSSEGIFFVCVSKEKKVTFGAAWKYKGAGLCTFPPPRMHVWVYICIVVGEAERTK